MNALAKKKDDPFIMIEAAIEGISYSLTQLHNIEAIDKLKGPMFIDLAARLNSQKAGLEKILEPMKDAIKADALTNSEKVIKGNKYQAVITRITKNILNTAKIKEFLGKNLYKFMMERDEVSVMFQVKE